MKTHSLRSGWLLASYGIALSASLTMVAKADDWDKRTILTVNQPIQVTDQVLQPGQYVFKLADSSSNRHIVQIFNRDETRLIDTVLAVPNYRTRPSSDSRFTFWETPPGNARALRAWFYPGDNFGQEFRYPKHPYTLEARASTSLMAPAAPSPKDETAAAPEPAPQPTAEAAPTKPEPAVEEPQAPSSSEPAPAAAPSQPAEAPSEKEPAELPKTASPYPFVGLAGLAMLGLSGIIRWKRQA